MPDGSFAVEQRKQFFVLESKAVEETSDAWVIRGMATTPRSDRIGDIVRPTGAIFDTLPKLMLYHDSRQPIGNVTEAKVTAKGIPFRAEIPKVKEPGRVKDRIDEAVHSVKYDLISFVSIGFNPLEFQPLSKNDPFGPQEFTKWEWLELSLVTIPANPDAVITGIKSIDDQLRAQRANGRTAPANAGISARQAAPTLPGRSGLSTKGNSMRTPQVLLAELEQERAEVATRMKSLYDKCEGSIKELEEAESNEYDNLEGKLGTLDTDIRRQRGMAAALSGVAASAKAVPFETGTDPIAARRVRHGDANPESKLPKGTTFARAVIAKAVGRGSLSDALQIAKQRWPDDHLLRDYLQKANAGTTVSGNWADDLSQPRVVDNEFIELLRPATILGRLQGTRSADFNTTYISQTSGSTVEWVGEAAAKPVGELAFSSVSIPIAKCAGIVVLSEEQIMVSRPNSEDVVRQDLVAQVAKFLDEQFIDPSVSAVANTNPASITNGASNFGAGGTTADDLRADLFRLFGYFANADMGVGGLTLIMTSNIAMGLALLTNSLGQPEFPGMTLSGGTLLGMNVIVSDNVPGSSSGGLIVAVKPSEIYIADAGGVKVDVSREATLDMSGGSTPAFSLWQKNCVGLRAERFISWAKRRSTAVAYISAAGYMPVNP